MSCTRRARAGIGPALAGALVAVLLGACAATPVTDVPAGVEIDAEDLLIVDCLLPGQVRRLGTQLTYLSPRRPIKTSASICEIRGGEYVAHDRADFSTALKIWLPQAEEGDAEAQTYVGEIYEKGLGAEADYALAAAWYRRAVEQGSSRASINLGYLYYVDGNAEIFKVLAHPDRIRLIEELRRGEKDVNTLSDTLDLPSPRVSQHLGLLKLHRIVEERREGRHHFYHLVQPEFAAWIVEGRMTGVSESEINIARELWSAQTS